MIFQNANISINQKSHVYNSLETTSAASINNLKKIVIHNGYKTNVNWIFLLRLESYIEREKKRKLDFKCR